MREAMQAVNLKNLNCIRDLYKRVLESMSACRNIISSMYRLFI